MVFRRRSNSARLKEISSVHKKAASVVRMLQFRGAGGKSPMKPAHYAAAGYQSSADGGLADAQGRKGVRAALWKICSPRTAAAELRFYDEEEDGHHRWQRGCGPRRL